ncbi:hypothetical protein A3F55_02825 [Candidatus Adlerbacteria bacterium RIFCSPHIGHO2_12_FULL_53_18]|uniref:Thioredoxin domain-containing protein n=1 Tax=Candidatus Adlerbacteria bacterium RIFCSPHIGHO2_12_FULL_53_18 TaxID=1797242 RepID=A0A1F4XTK4_9BACT|nr:MAG: hypothetical protein A3F55_02825 [Candidatus Adlerbacteria bacterium RIFCSPHIGHO2_12_FULL_53_18]
MEAQLSKFNLSPSVSIIIAGVIIAGAVIFTNKQPTGPVAANPEQPAAIDVDISRVRTEGEPFIGNANAPVTIAYWYDYQCPFCQRHEQGAMPQIIKDYVDTGKVKIVFKDFQFLGPDSQALGQYSSAVWEVAPDKFYLWHKAVYDNQGQENSGWATEAKITSITTNVLGASDTGKVATLVKSKGDEYQKEMDADKAEGAALGISGTPGSIVGKQLVEGAQPYAVFRQAIEAALTKN